MYVSVMAVLQNKFFIPKLRRLLKRCNHKDSSLIPTLVEQVYFPQVSSSACTYRRLFGQSLRNDRISYLYVGTLSVPSSEILHFLASGVLLCLICYHTSNRYCIGETVLFLY